MKYRQRHNHKTAAIVTLSGMALGLVLVSHYESPEALANDDKIFSPQFCVPVDSNNTIDEDDAEFWSSEVRSTDPDTTEFICPMVRDSITRELDRVWVRLNNQRAGDTTVCCVIGYNLWGENSDDHCVEANESHDGFQSLEIQGPHADDNGFYVLTCELQRDESILSYRISEDA